jgi:hypothetical protein
MEYDGREDIDTMWRSIYSLSERCEELEARVSLLEEDLVEDSEEELAYDGPVGPYPDEDVYDDEEEKAMGDIMEGLEVAENFEGEVVYDDNNKAST